MPRFRVYITHAYRDAVARFPRQFWILVAGSFIQAVGWGLVFPFFTLYFRQKLGVSMTSVGAILALFSIGNIAGQLVSGIVTDRVGRRPVILVTTFMHPIMMLAMIPGRNFAYFAVLGLVLGFFDEAFSPAANAMVADLVEEPDRLSAYSAIRIARNLGIVFGPALGGVIASASYATLWVAAAALLAVFFVIAVFAVDETRAGVETIETSGYAVVFSDRVFVAFLAVTTFAFVFVNQISITLPVYLKEVAGLGERYYGYLFSLNAAMVVLFQLPVASLVRGRHPGRALALGAAFYAVGLGMYAFTRTFAVALLAMAILTVGEIVMSPVMSAFVANVAPAEHRGKYMSVFGQTYSGAAAFVAPPLGGFLYETSRRLVWLVSGGALLAAAAAYAALPSPSGEAEAAPTEVGL